MKKYILILFACLTVTGRKLACKDAFAGVKKFYITTDSLGVITFDVTQTDVITNFAGMPEFFQFDLDGGTVSNLTETSATSRDNGTTVITQVLTAQFAKRDKDTHKELITMMASNPTIVVEDYRGNQMVMGLENQVNIGESTSNTGAARADFDGYNLTATAEERKFANFLDIDIVAAGGTISAVQIEA